MEEGVVRMAAQMYALVASMETIKIGVEGMKAANTQREHRRESHAYNECDFALAADEMREIATSLKLL